jgi:hypothetical protein
MKEETKERTKCEVWARCMGYHRPVSNFNPWKKAEFYWRKNFNTNKQFIETYEN